MAQSFTNEDGITLINPGTYVSVSVKSGQGAIASAGVVTLIGEADEGDGFLSESDLADVAFTPDQYGKVLLKYGSGRIVDAFRAIVAAANDPNIAGAVTLVRILKTNQSTAASALMSKIQADYAELKARKAGAPGNTIRFKSEAVSVEVAPETGKISYAPLLTGSASLGVRANGLINSSISVSAKQSAEALVASIEDLQKGILAKGGQEKLILPAAGTTISLAAADASTIVITLATGSQWTEVPEAGDTLVIPANGDYSAAQDSAISGAAGENVGTYIVQDATNTLTSATITAKKISAAGSLAGDSGTVSVDKRDIVIYKQIEIKNLSGQDLKALVGVDGSYQSTLNDGVNAKIQLPAGKVFATQPKAGDIAVLEAAFCSVAAGFYQVVSATTNTVTLTRLSEGSSGSTTSSEAVAAPVEEATQPMKLMQKEIDGLGKTLCIEGDVEAIFKKADGSAAGLSNKQLISASEYKNQMTYTKGDASESLKAGGEVVLLVGCSEEDATMVIDDSKIDFKVASVTRFSASYKDFKTLSDLASYISSQTNFSASVASSKYAAAKPADLDNGTFAISGLESHKNGRIKRDASEWAKANAGSTLVAVTLKAEAGLPVTSADKFLTGGAKNGTTSALITTAIDAAEKLETNFVVPLFSVDADADIEQSETESSSTYTIDAINAYAKAHVIKMSAIKMKKNRVALLSKESSYDAAKEAAGELSSYRTYLCVQKAKNVSSTGEIKMYQPWMSAIIAAGMQAAAGYKGIVKKFANVTGIATPEGDFDPNLPGDSEDALKAGILFMEKVPTGGFRWVSDQSTYSLDNNFVYNSLQAVYISDLITLTLIDRFDKLVVGKSVAQMTANAALSILEAEMFNFQRLRWIASSDDAPKGYKNATATLNGGVMEIAVEIKLAGLIYFVPISLSISQVTQTAAQQ
jgi:hypothetical protein